MCRITDDCRAAQRPALQFHSFELNPTNCAPIRFGTDALEQIGQIGKRARPRRFIQRNTLRKLTVSQAAKCNVELFAAARARQDAAGPRAAVPSHPTRAKVFFTLCWR